MERSIVVVAEHTQGRLTPVTYEAMACALEIQRIQPARIVTVVVGEDAVEVAQEAIDACDQSVLAVKVPGLDSYNGEAYRWTLSHALRGLGASWICVPGTTQGFDFGPGLAVRLGASCLSNIEQVFEQDGQPIFVRNLFNGKISAELSAAAPTLLIVQPGSFRWERHDIKGRSYVEVITVEWAPTHTRLLGFKSLYPVDSALRDALVIVSAGRGIERRENLELIHRVASLFPRSAVAGSRPLCDNQWLPYRLQVGQTGATVAPDLYMACGISGAQQHLAGMRGSKFIVAVNTDPEAAIFHEADVGVVEDLEVFLADLLEESARLTS